MLAPFVALSICDGRPAGAQAVEAWEILAEYPGAGQPLVSAVGQTIHTDVVTAAGYCQAAAEAPADVRTAVGAGLSYAFDLYTGAGDADGAAAVNQAACTCGTGEVLASYAAGRGGSIEDVCGTDWDAGSGPTPSLFRINADGGGGGSSVE